MLEKIYDNRVKLYALFLLALILALAVLCTIRATGFVIYEDGSWGFTVFQVKVTGCFPPMGCLVLDEVIPVDEEWLDHNEYTINGPLFQDNTLVISGWDYVVGDSTFWMIFSFSFSPFAKRSLNSFSVSNSFLGANRFFIFSTSLSFLNFQCCR